MDRSKNYFSQTSFASNNTLNSFINKKKRISKYIGSIEADISRLNNIMEKDGECIIKDSIYENFINYCECIYSCMEYLGYIMYIYQRRNNMLIGSSKGTPSSFHETINLYFDELKRDKYIIFKNNKVCRILEDISIWYYKLRAIRSKEIHYNNGVITIIDEKVIYNNEVEYGEQHPANEFDLKNARAFFTKFTNDTEKLINMLDGFEI